MDIPDLRLGSPPLSRICYMASCLVFVLRNLGLAGEIVQGKHGLIPFLFIDLQLQFSMLFKYTFIHHHHYSMLCGK